MTQKMGLLIRADGSTDQAALDNAKQGPDISAGPGGITITGHGTHNEPIDVVITRKPLNVKVYQMSGQLDADGNGTITVPLPSGSYHVIVTAYPPGADPVIYESDETVP